MISAPPRRLAIASLLLASLTGCPGELRDPERFDGVVTCRGGIDVHVLFQNRCGASICHGATASDPAAGLDLISPGLPQRLVGVPSEECDGFLRVDPDNPDNSFLLGKLVDPPAGCGDRMPLIGMLSPAEISCVRAYIHSIASMRFDAGPTPPDASIDAGPDASVDAGGDPDADVDLDGGMDLDASMLSGGGA